MQKDKDFGKQEELKDKNTLDSENSLLCYEFQQKFVQKSMIVFSLEKLLILLSQEEIKRLENTLEQQKDKAIRGSLELVPLQALPSVTEYSGKQYRCLHPSIKLEYTIQTYTFKSLDYLNHIAFPNLLILNLSKQKVSNLEDLTFVFAPQLKCLQLYDNQIWNMDTLIKADFPKLETISFYINPVMKMQQFYRFHSSKLRSYQFDSAKQTHFPLQDYRFLFKMEDPVPLKIILLNRRRINLKKSQYFKSLNQLGTRILYFDRKRYTHNGVRILRS